MTDAADEIRERDRRTRSSRLAGIHRTEQGIDLQVQLEDIERSIRNLRHYVRDEIMPELAR